GAGRLRGGAPIGIRRAVIIERVPVISVEQVYENGYVAWFHSPALSANVEPGQFVMVHCSTDGLDPMFARAFSYHRVEADRFALLCNVGGKGTAWLAERKRGDLVRVYGPLGNGFRMPDDRGNLLLVGGGVGVAPLIDLAERAVAAEHHVVAMMGARTAAGLL